MTRTYAPGAASKTWLLAIAAIVALVAVAAHATDVDALHHRIASDAGRSMFMSLEEHADSVPVDTLGDPEFEASSFRSSATHVLDHILKFLVRHAVHLGIEVSELVNEVIVNHGGSAHIFGFLSGYVSHLLTKRVCENVSKPTLQLIPCAIAAELKMHDDAAEVIDSITKHVHNDNRAPVVIVPGLMAATLDGMWTDASAPGLACDHAQHDWTTVWLNAAGLIAQDCLAASLKLDYSKDMKQYVSAKGVTIEAADGLGAIERIAHVGNAAIPFLSTYLARLVQILEHAGYTEETLETYTYDWRLGSEYAMQQLSELKLFQHQVSRLVNASDGRKAYIVGHGTGGLFAARLLAAAGPDWAGKHIAGLVTLGAPVLGAPKYMYAPLTGDGLGIHIFGRNLIKQSIVRATSRTFSGVLEASPRAGLDLGVPLVKTSKRSFTAAQVSDVWRAAGSNETAEAVDTLLGEGTDVPAPGVPVWCLYGYGLNTIGGLVYSDDTIGTKPEFAYVDGDGTVPTKSLRGCEAWGSGASKVTTRAYKSYSHAGLTSGYIPLLDVARIVSGLNATGGSPEPQASAPGSNATQARIF